MLQVKNFDKIDRKVFVFKKEKLPRTGRLVDYSIAISIKHNPAATYGIFLEFEGFSAITDVITAKHYSPRRPYLHPEIDGGDVEDDLYHMGYRKLNSDYLLYLSITDNSWEMTKCGYGNGMNGLKISEGLITMHDIASMDNFMQFIHDVCKNTITSFSIFFMHKKHKIRLK